MQYQLRSHRQHKAVERMIFEDIANVMNARPVKEIMRKTGLTEEPGSSLRMGCVPLDYGSCYSALQQMGYEYRFLPLGTRRGAAAAGDGAKYRQ